MFKGKRVWAAGVLTIALICATTIVGAQKESTEIVRKVRSKVSPTYPELARRMGLSGVARIEVVVSADGAVKEARIVGGHPVLANAALEAVRKWRFEPSSGESSGSISVRFDQRQ